MASEPGFDDFQLPALLVQVGINGAHCFSSSGIIQGSREMAVSVDPNVNRHLKFSIL
jgi:hypothetical protein